MQIVPASLVPIVKNYISNQGGNPLLVNPDGSIEPSGLLELFFNQAEVRTAITPPIIFPTGPDGSVPDATTQMLLNKLQPTVILSGRGGRVVIAPNGAAAGENSWWPLAIGATVLTLGLGYWFWRR